MDQHIAPRDGRAHVIESTHPRGWIVAQWVLDHFSYLNSSRVPGAARGTWQDMPYAYPSEQDARSALTFWQANE
jgi:hypothetical protein